MGFYKCGHDRKPVFIEDSILTYMEYENWRNTTGFDGDKSECWTCYCKRRNKEIEDFKRRMCS